MGSITTLLPGLLSYSSEIKGEPPETYFFLDLIFIVWSWLSWVLWTNHIMWFMLLQHEASGSQITHHSSLILFFPILPNLMKSFHWVLKNSWFIISKICNIFKLFLKFFITALFLKKINSAVETKWSLHPLRW